MCEAQAEEIEEIERLQSRLDVVLAECAALRERATWLYGVRLDLPDDSMEGRIAGAKANECERWANRVERAAKGGEDG